MVGVPVNLDEQPVRPRRDPSQGDRRYQVATTCAVRGIEDDRQPGPELENGDGRDIHAVSGGGFERTAASLAQHHLIVALREDRLSGLEHLLHRCRHASLQQDRLTGNGRRSEQSAVVHVPGADLDHVGQVSHKGNVLRPQCFGDHAHVQLVGHGSHDLETLAPQPLKAVRRCPGLERPAT